jgi:hypothetical protein
MKYLIKTLLFTTLIAFVLLGCEKVAPLMVYKSGTSATLSTSSTNIAPVVADSLKNVVTFSWTNPKYATDSNTVKYILQIDSSGRNFSKAVSITLSKNLSYTMVAKDLNAILLSFGFNYNTSYKIDVRIISSYANNNDLLTSNVLTINATPYVVPPKVVPPSSRALFLVGDATGGGWSNPVPLPTQQFTRVDSVTYRGTFYLIGGKQYLALPVNGDWTNKYSVADGTKVGLSAGGDFGYNLSSNFPGPAVTGFYTITMDFQRGKFTVALVKAFGQLFVPGGYQGWDPGTAPSLGSPKADGDFSGFINFTAATAFKLTSQRDWSGTNYGNGGAGLISSTGGDLNIATPGVYLIRANTVNNTFSAVRTTWGVVGAFTNWGSSPDIALTYSNGKYTGTFTLASASPVKFRANSDWGINLGDNGSDGVLEFGGDDVQLTAGTYNVTLNVSNAGYYTYSFIKQ